MSRPPRRRVATLTLATAAALLCAAGLVSAADDDTVWNAVAATLPTNPALAQALDPPTGTGTTVYLVIGSDRRPGWSGPPDGVRGERADAVMLVALRPPATVTLLSVPRDVRVHVPGHGDRKLGATLGYGRRALVESVRALTGVPVHHYVELDFDAVTAVADALGGIPVTLHRPARDPAVGLDLPAGDQRLDGAAALAFVRSRHYEEFDGAAWTADGFGDLGRIGRQQQVLTGTLEAFRSRCGSLACAGLLHDLSRAVTVDPGVDGRSLRRLAAAVGSAASHGWLSTLPTRPQRPAEDSMSPFPPAHQGNSVYRVLDEPAASAALAALVGPSPLPGR